MLYNPYETKPYVWAIRTLNPKDDKDKRSINGAQAGYGYYIINAPDGVKQYYVAAFKHFGGELRPGAELATDWQANKLEDMDAHRYWREQDHRKPN